MRLTDENPRTEGKHSICSPQPPDCIAVHLITVLSELSAHWDVPLRLWFHSKFVCTMFTLFFFFFLQLRALKVPSDYPNKHLYGYTVQKKSQKQSRKLYRAAQCMMHARCRLRQAGAVWYDYNLIYMICICITHTVLPARFEWRKFQVSDKARTPDKDTQDTRLRFLSAGSTCVQCENWD